MPPFVVACKVLRSLFQRHAPDLEAVYLEYGWHRVPQDMAGAIQEEIDRIPPPRTIVLGYGLCGNGIVGVRSGEHTLIVPRVDDCIAILLGSYRRYLNELSRHPATYYLSKGWIECGSNPLKVYQEYLEKYDEETARWLIASQYGRLRRLLFVVSEEEDLANYGPYAHRVADFLGAAYQECRGRDGFIRRLLRQAVRPQPHPDFLVIPPGGEVEQAQFWRWEKTAIASPTGGEALAPR